MSLGSFIQVTSVNIDFTGNQEFLNYDFCIADDGSSFGNVLFYGHEFTLVTFDVLVFCVIDLAGVNNTVLNGLIVWLIGWLVDILRENVSSRNLAKKTLVDERFLI